MFEFIITSPDSLCRSPCLRIYLSISLSLSTRARHFSADCGVLLLRFWVPRAAGGEKAEKPQHIVSTNGERHDVVTCLA